MPVRCDVPKYVLERCDFGGFSFEVLLDRLLSDLESKAPADNTTWYYANAFFYAFVAENAKLNRPLTSSPKEHQSSLRSYLDGKKEPLQSEKPLGQSERSYENTQPSPERMTRWQLLKGFFRRS